MRNNHQLTAESSYSKVRNHNSREWVVKSGTVSVGNLQHEHPSSKKSHDSF